MVKPLRLDEKRTAQAAAALVLLISAVDVITPPSRIYLGLLIAPPLIAAARCAPRITARVAVFSLLAALLLGIHAEIWLNPDHLLRLLAVLVAGVLGTAIAWERTRAETSKVASEARYRALADASAAGVWNITPDGYTQYVNASMCRMLEISGPEELAGKKYHEFYTPESLEAIRTEHAKRLEGQPSTYTVTIVGRRGTRRSVLLSGSPVFGPDGEMTSLIGTFIDVSERRRLEQIRAATYRISEAVHKVPTLHELYAEIHAIVGELMPAANFYIALCDNASDAITFPYSVDEFDPSRAPRKQRKGLTEYVLRTGAPLLVTSAVMRDLVERGEVVLSGTPSIDWLGVPLQTGGKTIGALVVQSYTEGVRYTDAEREILQFVSAQVAMAIERKRSDEALRETGVRLAQSQAIAHLGSWELDLTDLADVNRNPLWWSDESYRIFGYEPGRVPITNDLFFRGVHPDDAPRIQEAVARTLKDGTPYFVEHRIIRPDGSERIVQEQSTLVRDEAGRPQRMVGTVLDVTEARQLENQLRQAQKMEAVGRLAGGMAHDFNNLLTAVLATSDMLATDLAGDKVHREDVEIIRAAAARGADLTRKLLAFSRRQRLTLDTVSLPALLAEFTKLARRVVPEDVEVTSRSRVEEAMVRADPVAVEQMLMNLVTNARDAMPAGGKLLLEIDRITLDHTRCRAWGWGQPGDYVTLTVADTGAGMDAETVRRIFEPFYTTKRVGEGTGLGMAMVYGLVKQHDGYINVESEPGRGATVRIYFPATAGAARAAPEEQPPEVEGHGEMILVVEDDATLRQSARRVLERSGYSVVTASDGFEALAYMESAGDRPDLIITDVVMPRVSGPHMVSQLQAAGRAPRVLFTSGYPAHDMHERTTLDPTAPMLVKPWTINELLRRVREVLDAPVVTPTG